MDTYATIPVFGGKSFFSLWKKNVQDLDDPTNNPSDLEEDLENDFFMDKEEIQPLQDAHSSDDDSEPLWTMSFDGAKSG